MLLVLTSLAASYLQHTENHTSSTSTTKLSKLSFDYDVTVDGALQLTYLQCKTNDLYKHLFILSDSFEGRNIQCTLVKPKLTSSTYQMSMASQDDPIAVDDAMETGEPQQKTELPKPSSEGMPNGADGEILQF